MISAPAPGVELGKQLPKHAGEEIPDTMTLLLMLDDSATMSALLQRWR